jgi:inhibitor of cysteine peptidase
MQFDESANNRTVDVKTNDEFEIVLPEVRTAGYQWGLTGSTACQLIREETEPNLETVGGSGVHRFRFRAVSPGACQIQLHYSRSWAKASKPAQTFTLNVQVRP